MSDLSYARVRVIARECEPARAVFTEICPDAPRDSAIGDRARKLSAEIIEAHRKTLPSQENTPRAFDRAERRAAVRQRADVERAGIQISRARTTCAVPPLLLSRN